jgi:glycosyltransferase involved in cell wall biosynthesis
MAQKPLVSIVMGAYNRLEFLKLAIESAREETKHIPHEILVVDGGSDDGSLEWLMAQKDIVTIIQHNRGEFDGKPIQRRSWGYFMNLVFKSAQAPYILMMSDDTIFHTGAVQNGLDFIAQQQALGKKIGAVPFYFHDIDEDAPHEYKVLALFDTPLLNHGIYVREPFKEVGYADEDSFLFYASDSDICFKLIHAGYEVLPCPTALMLHCPNHPTRFMTTSNDKWVHDATALINKWRGIFVDDTMTVEKIILGNRTVHYVDETDSAKKFNAVLAITNTDTPSGEPRKHTSTEMRLDQLETRLQNVMASVRYSILLNEQAHKVNEKAFLLNERAYLEWKEAYLWDSVPLYRKILSRWAIFAPLRAVKARIMKGK